MLGFSFDESAAIWASGKERWTELWTLFARRPSMSIRVINWVTTKGRRPETNLRLISAVQVQKCSVKATDKLEQRKTVRRDPSGIIRVGVAPLIHR